MEDFSAFIGCELDSESRVLRCSVCGVLKASLRALIRLKILKTLLRL